MSVSLKTTDGLIKISGGAPKQLTYELGKNANGEIVLISSEGTITKVVDSNTTYTFSEEDKILTIKGSDGTLEFFPLGEEITKDKIIAALGYTPLESYTETDPTVPSHVKSITIENISNWNNKAEVSAIPTKASDIGAMANTVTHLSGDVPVTRTVNGKALSSDLTLNASDVGALSDDTDLTIYALASEAGYDLGLTMDSKTYEMTLELKNKAGVVLSTKTLDFPIESMVVDASYADGVITLTLQNGTTLPVDISSIVGGLVNDSFTIAGIDMKDNITAAELKTALGIPSSYAPTDAQANVIETIKVNNTALTPSSKAVNITVPTKASDIGAMADSVTHLSGDVPTTRTINGKALSLDITLSASDVNALPSSTIIPTVTDTYSATSSDAMSGKAVASAISGKQASLSDEQMNAVNSGITSTKVSTYDGYASQIAGKGTYSKPSGGIPASDLASGVIPTTLPASDVSSWAKADNKPDYEISELTDWSTTTDVTISGLTYHTFWKNVPTASNQVYGIAMHPTYGYLCNIYNNKGTYSAGNYATNTIPQGQCETSAADAAKKVSCTAFSLMAKSYIMVNMRYANTSATALTLNINSTGAKPIYINGSVSSTTNYTLPAGSYIVYYNGTNYYFRTDGKITGSITGDAATVNGLTVQTAVPANANFMSSNDKAKLDAIGSMTMRSEVSVSMGSGNVVTLDSFEISAGTYIVEAVLDSNGTQATTSGDAIIGLTFSSSASTPSFSNWSAMNSVIQRRIGGTKRDVCRLTFVVSPTAKTTYKIYGCIDIQNGTGTCKARVKYTRIG